MRRNAGVEAREGVQRFAVLLYVVVMILSDASRRLQYGKIHQQSRKEQLAMSMPSTPGTLYRALVALSIARGTFRAARTRLGEWNY